ncbi:MAG: hypothetical protein WCR20_09480 [Verrucomicrobiota bacterium]|jgi:hypothetical protein
MHLRYDEDFVEAVVHACTSGRPKAIPALQITRFNRHREKLYSISDPDERNTAFFNLHLEWFREWGFEKVLTEPLVEFPLLPGALKILAFRKSRGKDDDSAELYVNETGERNGVVAMRPERVAGGSDPGPFLRHEFTHLQDMIDPGFAYAPDLHLVGPSLNQHRLARERYRALWDVSIDGRLTRLGRQTIATREQRRMEFSAAFAFWPEARQNDVFESLWSHPHPTHQILEELVCDPRQLQTTTGPRPGAPCPLCGFPTFAWVEAGRMADDTVAMIQTEFPHWAAMDGVCGRCYDVYRVKKSTVAIVV